jgi:DNA replicative helicase MCM subunit Mcm2 (Cdc46/Mcm family)
MKQGVVDVMFILIDFLILYRRATLAREERKNDIPKLLQFFQEMRTQNERFYYEIQLDENNVIQNVFWSHASQCAEYQNFGDVLTFDTTYQTNIYRMLLAMFVRSNHQLQNVIFRQAHEGLKEKLRIVINHPLRPEEFDAASNALVDEYGICENVAIEGLWKQRELWIPAYFKMHYCGRMMSTQRSESVNKMVKGSGFVTHMTSLNTFARKASACYSTHKS